MKEGKFEKYDVRRMFASALAAKENAKISDVSYRVINQDGIKKVRVEVLFGDDTDWQLVQVYWATNLPTPEDLDALRGAKITDVLLQTGWNEDEEKWGAIKVVKFVTADGEEVVFNGPRDEPGLKLDEDGTIIKVADASDDAE